MRRKLFIYTSLVIILVILSVFISSLTISHRNNLKLAEDSVKESAHIFADIYKEDIDLEDFVKLGEFTRVTIIKSNGDVLKDTRPLVNPENHLDRPEVIAALEGNPTPYIRYSESLGTDYVYYAVKVETQNDYVFIRTSVPVATINSYLNDSLPILILTLIVSVVLCFILTKVVIQKTTEPFDDIERRLRIMAYGQEKADENDSSTEIDDMSREINEIASLITVSINSLKEEKEKADYILSNISEGLIIVNKQNHIQLINSAALAIFGLTSDITGKNLNYITYNNTIGHAVRECQSSDTNTVFELNLKGRIYFVSIKRLSQFDSVMVTLTDVSEVKEISRRREEFFANASHELKTPLTAIKGFNELAQLNNKDKAIEKYINSISHETDRMLSLIADMLKLSELETSSSTPLDPTKLSLVDTVNEVLESFNPLILEKELSVNIIGNATVLAKTEHLYELIKNIVENAIRYNKQNGNISITIESEGSRSWLFVFDNGIGISPEEQTKIFERFYRVEKSRSSRGGGTGLGLSIVKHICSIYGWDVSLKSTLGLGTEITIAFN